MTEFETAMIVTDLVQKISKLRQEQGRLATTLNGVVAPNSPEYQFIFRQFGLMIANYELQLKVFLK